MQDDENKGGSFSAEMVYIREQLAIMNTKLDYMADVKKTSERAEKKAEEALHKTDANTKSIEDTTKTVSEIREEMSDGFDGIKKAAMWAIGTLIAFGGVMVAVFTAVLK